MFEEDTEEYLYDRLDPKAIDSVSEFANKHIEEAIVSSFKDGAEFGYNKCFEQIRKIVNEGTRLDSVIPELLRLQESE